MPVGTVALIGDSPPRIEFAGAVAELLEQAGIEGTYQDGERMCADAG